MSKAISKISFLTVLASLLSTCDKYEFPKSPYPRIETLPVVNISENGVTFQGNITQFGSLPITNHGFVWGAGANFAISTDDKVQLGAASKLGNFEVNVKSGLNKDQAYFVKAFAATADYFVYGQAVPFTSKGSTPPVIKNFSPLEGTWGDTITIKGNYFSALATNNLVKFGSRISNVLISNDSTIKCTVPTEIPDKTARIFLTVTGNQTQSPTNFILTTPEIHGFSPVTGTFNDVITLTGKNFSASKEKNVVKFNESVGEVISASKAQLKVKVPTSITKKENTLTVTLSLQSGAATGNFTILPPSITTMPTQTAFVGQTIQIMGDNFNPSITGNIVLLGGNLAVITSASKQLITVKVPQGVFKSRTNPFEVTVAEQTTTSPGTITVQDPWIRKANSPATDYPLTPFAINGKGYAVSGNKCWRFDPVQNVWVEMAQFPGQKKFDQLSFVIGDKGYVGMGAFNGNTQTDFWMYNPQANSWTRVADFPFVDSSGAWALSADGKGYLAAGFATIALWEYDPAGNSWGQRGDELNSNFVGYPHRVDAGFAIDNRLFFYLADETTAANPLFEYDLTNDVWINRGQAEQNDYLINHYTTGYSARGKGYIRGVKFPYKYDPIANTWEIKPEGPPGDFYSAESFQIDDKAYFVGAYNGVSFEIWEFDPDYE